MSLPLSVCLIARDEEENLPALLASVAPLQAELVVVDTGSTDRTREIARAAGAKVVEWAWRNDFAAARNVSLEHATRPWILWLDADDRLPAASLPEIRRLVSQAPERAYSFLIKNTLDQGRTGTEFSQIRMFPNHPRLRFFGAVHEQVYPALVNAGVPLESLRVMVHHTGYTDPETVRRKQRRNQEILKERAARGEAGAIQYYQMGACEADLDHPEEAERLFRRCVELVRAGDPDRHMLSVVPGMVASLRLRREDWVGARGAFLELADPDPVGWHPNQTALAARMWSRLDGDDAGLEFWEKAFTPKVREALLPVDPKLVSFEPLRVLADHWRARGRETLGVEILRLLKRLLEDSPPDRHELPEAYLRGGLPERASELFAWCIEKDGPSVEAWSGLVASLAASGRQQEAEGFRQAGRERWPEHTAFIGGC